MHSPGTGREHDEMRARVELSSSCCADVFSDHRSRLRTDGERENVHCESSPMHAREL